MARIVLLVLLCSVFLLCGCPLAPGPTQPDKNLTNITNVTPQPPVNNTPLYNITPGQNITPPGNKTGTPWVQPTAPITIPDDGLFFDGTFPEQNGVPYTTKSGKSLIAPAAYPGFVYLFTDYINASDAESGIRGNGGRVVAALPEAGLYLIQVKEGSEGSFLSAMYRNDWVRDGIPASPPEIATISVYDYFFDSRGGDKLDCGKNHGDVIALQAGRLGGSVETVDCSDMESEGFKSGKKNQEFISMAASMRERIKQAAANGENVVISMSLGSTEDHVLKSKDWTDCKDEKCEAARNGQMQVWRIFLQMFDSLMANSPDVAEHGMLVISAGNTGVDLDEQIGKLQNEFPSAFKHLIITGSSEIEVSAADLGKIDNEMNHLKKNTAENGCFGTGMVYSLGDDVLVRGADKKIAAKCSGTSFATPEVAAVLDYIWRQRPELDATAVNYVFDHALDALGKNCALPQIYDESTSKDFLGEAARLAQEAPSVSITSAKCTTRDRIQSPSGDVILSWTADASGTASGPVGATLTGTFTANGIATQCSTWGSNCVRDPGEPAATTWQTTYVAYDKGIGKHLIVLLANIGNWAETPQGLKAVVDTCAEGCPGACERSVKPSEWMGTEGDSGPVNPGG